MKRKKTAANFGNQTIWTGDNLEIMRGMNSGSVALIYLDPPFNSKADYAAPIGSQAAGAAFKDTWTLDDIDIAWIDLIEREHAALRRVLLAAMTDNDKSCLTYMALTQHRYRIRHRIETYATRRAGRKLDRLGKSLNFGLRLQPAICSKSARRAMKDDNGPAHCRLQLQVPSIPYVVCLILNSNPMADSVPMLGWGQ